MFPALLKESGYYTGAAGKWHMGEYARKAFDVTLGRYTKSTGGEEDWLPCLQGRDKNKPFFLWLGSSDAHRPFTSDKQAEPHKPEDVVIEPYMIDTPLVRQDMARYYDEVRRFDRSIGQVVDELKKQGVYENTYIIVMADNGRPFARCKTRLLDSGIKTPFIIHCPAKLSKDIVCDSLVSVLDIAPTVLELARVKVSETFQGFSMCPLLDDPKAAIRKYVFAEHNWHAQDAHERMVRHGDFVYIRNGLPQVAAICKKHAECPQKELRELYKQGKLTPAQMDPLIAPRPAEELFNIKKDIHQITNLADNPEYTSIMDDMRKVMDEWKQRTGDTDFKRTKKRMHFVAGRETGADKINDPGPR